MTIVSLLWSDSPPPSVWGCALSHRGHSRSRELWKDPDAQRERGLVHCFHLPPPHHAQEGVIHLGHHSLWSLCWTQSWDSGDQLERQGNIPPSFPNASCGNSPPFSHTAGVWGSCAQHWHLPQSGARVSAAPHTCCCHMPSPWLMSPLSPETTFPLMSPLLQGLIASEAAAAGAGDKSFHSPAGSVGAESPRWVGTPGSL